MFRISASTLFLCLFMVTSATPCGFHNYTPQPTLVDRLLASDEIVLARAAPDNPFRFEAIQALEGDLAALKQALDHDETAVLTERDDNGWQALHKGVASGMREVVELLVQRGAEINARTHGGFGESPLRIAEKLFEPTHSVVLYLKGLGALSLGPEL